MIVARPWKKARSVNSDSANFPTWVSTELLTASLFTDPATASGRFLMRLAMTGGNGVVPCALHVMPYALGADNDTFSMRVVGFRRMGQPNSSGLHQFAKQIIATLNCTISTAVGLAGQQVIDTERFADTITAAFEGTTTVTVTAVTGVSTVLHSPTNNTPGSAIIPLFGYEIIEFEFDQTLNTPTMNALISFLDGEQ